MSLLQIEGLNLSIHGAPILKNVGLSVAPGQIVGVIGESGSGKSMTAFAALQLLPHGSVCSGRIILNGQDVLNMPEPSLCQMRGRDVGMVFQEPIQNLWLLRYKIQLIRYLNQRYFPKQLLFSSLACQIFIMVGYSNEPTSVKAYNIVIHMIIIFSI